VKFRPEHLLDRCLHQLDEGNDVEEVLAAYPELADELRPALAASEWMRAFAPPPRRRLEHKGRFVAVVAERRRLVERVDGLVVEIKAGVSPAELGARLDASLLPVIAAAHRMQATEIPRPAPERFVEGRLRLMALAAERRSAVRPARTTAMRSVRHGMLQGLLPKPTLGRRLLSSAAVLSLAAALAFAGVIRVQSVAASSLPGEALYGVKRLGENARMLFAFDPTRRAGLEAVFAQRRTLELLRLEAEGRSVPVDFVEEWLIGHATTGAMSDLTRDQREALSRVLRAVSDDEAARARLQGTGVAPAVLDSLLAPEPESPEPAASDKPIGLNRGPSLRPLPLPEERPAQRPAASKAPAAPQPEPFVTVAPTAPVGFVESVELAAGPDSGGQGGSGAGGAGSAGTVGGQAPAPGGPALEPIDDPVGDPGDEPPPFIEPFDPGPQAPPSVPGLSEP